MKSAFLEVASIVSGSSYAAEYDQDDAFRSLVAHYYHSLFVVPIFDSSSITSSNRLCLTLAGNPELDEPEPDSSRK